MGDDGMIEACGDIWEHLGKAVIAVTTSGSVARNGKAVMGRGVARQAVQRFPAFPLILGLLLDSRTRVEKFSPRVSSPKNDLVPLIDPVRDATTFDPETNPD